MPSIDKLIHKYLKGTSTQTEEQSLLQWMKNSDENRNRLFSEKDIWDTLGYHSNHKGYEENAELQIFRKQRAETKNGDRFRYGLLLRIAAVFIVAFGLGWATQFFSLLNKDSHPEVSLQEIVVPKGQVNQIFLADGTRIWINSESTVTLPSVFASDERVVKLSGEAFFQVAKDPDRPFRVEVKGQKVEVLGTSFNIRAYAQSPEIETTLATGKIKLYAGEKVQLLNPGDQSHYKPSTGQLSFTKVDPVNYISWKEGRYEFQNEDLAEVFELIERWYDVEISYDTESFKSMRFSGVIKRNKDILHFLTLLDHSIPINYIINGDKIIISLK